MIWHPPRMTTCPPPKRPLHPARFVTVLLLALGPGAAALASEAPATPAPRPTFNLRAAEPDVGSHLPRRLVTGSAIPLDQTWEELSPAHRRLWSSQYEAMGPGDEPPFPRRGLQSIHRAFDRASQGRVRTSGVVEMEVVVDAEGVPQEVRVLSTPGPDATRVLAAVLLAETFKPARCSGQPCTMAFPFRFALNRRLL